MEPEEALVRSPVPTLNTRLEELTATQAAVLRLLAEGLTARQIGETMSLAESTVKNHLSEIYGRLGAHNMAHAVALGFRRGFLA